LVKIHRSTFSGTNWSELYNGNLSGSYGGNFLATSDLFIVTTTEAFHRSTDRGVNWSSIQSGLPNYGGIYNMSVSSIIRAGSTLYVGFDNGHGVYRSEDNGLTWKATNYRLPNRYVYRLRVDNNKIYAGSYNSYLAYLIDGDTTWNVLTSGPQGSKGLYVNQSTIFASSEIGMFRSIDGGATWDTLRNGIQTSDGINSITGGGGSIYAGAKSGFYSSTDNGANWNSLNNGFPGENFTAYSIAFAGDTLLLGTAAGIYRTLDNGSTWQFSGSGGTTDNVWSIYSFNGILFASFSIPYRSDNSGQSWVKYSNGFPPYLIVSSIISDDSTLYVTTQNGLYRSTDDGADWQDANGGMSFSTKQADVIQQDVYMSCQYGFNPGTWFTSNKGETWTDISAGLPSASSDPVVKFFNLGGNVIAVTGQGLVYSSSNHGNSWNALTTNLPSVTVLSGFQFGNTLSIATYNGPYFSSNGTTWTLKTEGITEYPFDPQPVAVHNGVLYAVAAQYMYTRPVAEVVTSVNDYDEIPLSMYLFQNYPNPFNPTTEIGFQTSDVSHVTLKVYNLLGQEVSTLVNDVLGAGYTSVEFDASSLPSGLYIYRITAGTYSQSKKLMLAK
jgi:photosystem II stability/assembly factor-like uncharacterized protein